MARTVVVSGAKGGAGKTGVVWQLAGEFHRRELRVLLVDADPRGVAVSFHRQGVHLGRDLFHCIGVGDDVALRVRERRSDYDVILIDTEGTVGHRLSRALEASDVALLPVKPEPSDLIVLAESIDVVRRKERRYPVRGYLLLCCAKQTRLGRAAAHAVACAPMPSMATVLKASQKYSDTSNDGRYITGQFPKLEEADQLRALADELLGVLDVRGRLATA